MDLRRLAVACALLLLAARFADAETLTIATYNLANYGPADRMTEDGFRLQYPKPEVQKRALRAVIKSLDVDILVVQEIGPLPYLDELRRDLRSAGCDYPYFALGDASDADRHVAILSRRPLAAAATLSDLDFPYFGARERVKRGLLAATVRTSAGRLTLYAVHLKSRLTVRRDDPESEIRRVGEATAIRDEILRRHRDPATALYVLLGDCNDGRASRAVERLLHRGDTMISCLLPAGDIHDETWTYWYRHDDRYERVDHVLVSPGLRAAVVDRADIGSGADVAAAGDHRPVRVRLDFSRLAPPAAEAPPPSVR